MSKSKSIEDKVGEATSKYLDALTSLSEEAYFQEAIAKMALREVIWGVLERLNFSQYEMDEHLTGMIEAIKDKR